MSFETPENNVGTDVIKERLAALRRKVAEASGKDGAEKLQENWREGVKNEEEMDALDAATIGENIKEFTEAIEQAKAVGVPTAEEEGILVSLKEDEERLHVLGQRQTELKDDSANIAKDPEVMSKVQGEAIAQNEVINKEVVEEYNVTRRAFQKACSESIDNTVAEIFGDPDLAETFGLDGVLNTQENVRRNIGQGIINHLMKTPEAIDPNVIYGAVGKALSVKNGRGRGPIYIVGDKIINALKAVPGKGEYFAAVRKMKVIYPAFEA